MKRIFKFMGHLEDRRIDIIIYYNVFGISINICRYIFNEDQTMTVI